MNLQNVAASVGSPTASMQYRDPKRYVWLLVPLWILTPVLSTYLAVTTGYEAWYWLAVLLTYVVFPIIDLDALAGRDSRNPPGGAVSKLDADRWYTLLLYITVPCHYITLIVGAWAVGTQHLSVLGYVGTVWSCGLMNGFAIATAHELGHKKTSTERWLAKVTLATGFYGQYMIDHNRGHHRDVATPEDSGSAQFGENFWQFMILRQIPHSTIIRPWHLEKERLARKGKGPWTLANAFLQPALISLVVYVGLACLFGWVIVPYLVGVAFIAYLFLALADYIEHYGLLREKLPDGRYARVRPEHSWNTNHIASNIIFWNVQRHSDHHAHPTRRYQVLLAHPHVPEMPTGYPGMFGIALVPWLWRWIMYPRVLAFHGHDLTKMNVHPKRREELMRKYHHPINTSSVATCDAPVPGPPRTEAEGASGTACHQCPGCGYVYNESHGDTQQGFKPGTHWSQIPANWQCPDCAVRDKVDFIPLKEGEWPQHAHLDIQDLSERQDLYPMSDI